VTLSLAEAWRSARPPVAGLHMDSAACSRQSLSTLDATARHARHEAEVGGYVAADSALPVLNAGRAAVAALTGMLDAQVVFTTGSQHALDLLLSSWPNGGRRLACLPGEYGPNLALMSVHGVQRQTLPVDGEGRVALAEAATSLAADPPDAVHLTAVASHRGVVQPLAEMSRLCRDVGVPLIVDAAQALGQVDCAVGADAVYASSRKWLAGPRGVGVLALAPTLLQRLQPRLPPKGWVGPLSVADRLELGEANIAARVGFSVAIGELLGAGPPAVRARLAEVGGASRTALADVPGWRVVEAVDEPSAITTLAPLDDTDPTKVRTWLIAERRIVTTAVVIARAPLELTGPVLRLSPHVDCTDDDLSTFAAALAEASAAV
jgi:pyridoxal 5-phosphate dependent beta-lyase